MAKDLPPFLQKIVDKFSNSRDFTISFALHVILILIFGGTVLFQAAQEPPDFEGGDGSFVQADEQAVKPPTPTIQTPPVNQVQITPPPTSTLTAITTTAVNPLSFEMNPTVVPVMTAPVTPTPTTPQPSSSNMDAATAAQIASFTGWGKKGGPGTGIKEREFEFTAYIGQYSGGNWNSTISVVQNKIDTGSLPNLLFLMDAWSRNKIKTNYKSVKAIKLDSDEIFAIKPPFIFLTGTRDFKLTEKEVSTLQKYVRMGGCIWGDSSLPGLRSRFDIAFRREMKRVIPDVDKDFEPLPLTHPIFTQNLYFPEIKEQPPGLNFYKEPVFALKIYGEIAILYTANDYGDMWQVGLNQKGEIDTRRNARGQYVAINPTIYSNRDVYLRNISAPAITNTFKFGTNVVLHLLTRWENKTKTASSL